MANIDKNEAYNDNDLFVYNKNNGSFVNINGFYSIYENSIIGFGDGRIETVKAGKTTLKNVQSEDLYTDFNELRATVASYLSSCGESSVSNVLYGNNDLYKQDLAYIFENQELPPV